MINTESNGIGASVGGTSCAANDKLSAASKKTALRDVQNENAGSINKQQGDSTIGGGRPSGGAIKVCGTKRLTPERPSSSPSHLYMACNGANENVMNARRRFEFELGRGKLQNMEIYSDCPQPRTLSQLTQEIPQKQTHMKENHIHLVPVASQNQMAPMMTFSTGGPSVPSSLGKQSNVNQAPISDYLKVSSEPQKIDLKASKEQQRADRFIQLHKFLEQCDKTNQREYTQKLLNLSPAELSKHAIELEKRAIQLILEEGEEMRRMKSLNILRKSAK